jgi:hypothetical protein
MALERPIFKKNRHRPKPPPPNPEPRSEPADHHEMPLDDDDDARFLRRDDPRRIRVEERRGRRFDTDPR